jgi:acetolactate synthase-1/2/3 large subunit
MAAEGYFRTNNKIALINVTTGPGAINALNGVFGAFVDSIPMLIISGQVKTETMLSTTCKDIKLRQLGDQEVDLFNLVKPVVKYVATPTNIKDTILALKNCLHYLYFQRPGPVWLDIPINLQASYIEKNNAIKIFTNKQNKSKNLDQFIHANTLNNKKLNKGIIKKDIEYIIDIINKSERPLILVGNGVRISNTKNLFEEIIKKLKIPVVSAWNSHDLIAGNNPYNCGKPSTVGDRPGNFAIKNCDVLIVIGSRLNIRQISYNWKSFAKDAKVLMIDIDKNEMFKKTLNIHKKFHYSLEYFLPYFKESLKNYKSNNKHKLFLEWCKKIKIKYPVVHKGLINNKYLNPYKFFKTLYTKLNKNDKVILGNGTACVVGLQCADLKDGIRVFTNSGSASMGYDLPAAIGSAIANKKNRVICVTGDGSIMMNIQELVSIAYKKLPIKIFLLNNGGYHSIRQTQKNFFPDNLAGTSVNDGVGFPNFYKVGKAFNINTFNINTIHELKYYLNSTSFRESKPNLLNINIDQKQDFEPKLKSKLDKWGKIQTPELHDMWPFLKEEEIKNNLILN